MKGQTFLVVRRHPSTISNPYQKAEVIILQTLKLRIFHVINHAVTMT